MGGSGVGRGRVGGETKRLDLYFYYLFIFILSTCIIFGAHSQAVTFLVTDSFTALR